MQSDRHASPFPRNVSLAVLPARTALRAFAALTAGGIAACGFPPLSLWALTLLGVAWLLELAMHARSGKQAFALGWCFGLGHFTLGNNWIATAFTYQASMPAWLGMIAVVLLSLYLALFPAFTALLAWKMVRPDRALSVDQASGDRPATWRVFMLFVLAFAGFWIFTEWVRSWLFSGFAWNPLGVAFLGKFESAGFASLGKWTGAYGLSGLLVLLSASLGLCLRFGRAGGVSARWIGTAAGVVIAVGLSLGMLHQPASQAEGAISFTLVQPDLRQEVIDDTSQFELNSRKLAMLSLPRDPGERRLVLWPESGVSDFLRDGYPSYLYRIYTYAGDPYIARKRIGHVIGPYGLLLTGAVDLVIENGESKSARNSVTAIDGNGNILAGYSKAHLVPFGEYLPLRGLLEPLGATRLVAGFLDFIPGPGPRTIDFGSYGKAGIQICYEIIFSGKVVDRSNRPDYIFNPSNDGWFGTWGPPQHLAQARMRAIEEGLPVLRSTTTGISAVIDADGIVRAFVPHHQAGRLDGLIPPAHKPTFFARFGNAIPLTLAGMLIFASFCMVALSRRRV